MLDVRRERRVVAMLGGRRALGLKGSGPMAWIHAIRKGFPTSALDALGENLNATNVELGQMIGISTRALAGRRRKGNLSSFESERLLRVASVVVRAKETFDNLGKGLVWLKQPKISLGGETPLSLLDTAIGAELVVDMLGRIEHGIFA